MLKSKLSKVIVIVGPTASGKTALSLRIARGFRGEIISADSRQIYKGMDIGTAKPSKAEMKSIKHHLIDIKKPDQDYSAGQFKKDTVKIIEDILKRNRIPIIIGGTGLYISSLVNNLDIPQVKENKQLRKQLEKEIITKGLKFVFDKLVELDPEAAYIIDPNNPRRVIRAMEIALGTGKPFSEQRKKGKPLYEFLQIGITLAPDILKQRIEKRIEFMFQNGLVREVKALVKKFGEKQKAFDAIGYREVIKYLNNKITLQQSEEEMKINTWHYAKRQMTRFNKDKSIKWITDPKEAEKLVLNFLD